MSTLSGGGSFPNLFYSPSDPYIYAAAQGAEASIGPLGVDYDSVPSGSTGAMTATTNLQLDIGDVGNPAGQIVGNGMSTVTASGYSAIFDSSVSPVNITFGGNSAGETVVAGSGGGFLTLDDNTNATIIAGDGTYHIGHGNGTGTMSIAAGNGNDTIADLQGNATISTGSGNNFINLYSGQDVITLRATGGTGANADQISAGIGSESVSVAGNAADQVYILENESFLSFTNGSVASTIRGGGTSVLGGGGATTINAGGTGTVTWEGESYNFFTGGVSAGNSNANYGDQVTDNSSSNDTLIGGNGLTTINAAGSTGNVWLETGNGNATLIGSSVGGADTFEVFGLSGGSHSVTIQNWSSSDTFMLSGQTVNQTDNPTVAGGQFALSSTGTLTLNDGTVITFSGAAAGTDITVVGK